MIVTTVYEPPEPPSDRLDRAAGHEFVGDGFSLLAAVFAPLWLLANRIWLGFAGYAAAFAVLAGIAAVWSPAAGWAGVALGALHLAIGFEAASLKRLDLERRGWTQLGTVAGRNLEECERRFYADWLQGKPYAPGPSMSGGARGAGLTDAVDDARQRARNVWSRVDGWRSAFRRT